MLGYSALSWIVFCNDLFLFLFVTLSLGKYFHRKLRSLSDASSGEADHECHYIYRSLLHFISPILRAVYNHFSPLILITYLSCLVLWFPKSYHFGFAGFCSSGIADRPPHCSCCPGGHPSSVEEA